MRFDQRTLGICLRENAERQPDKMAMEYAPTPATYWSCTWKELDETTDLLAVRLHDRYGIKQGTHVGIWSMNSPAFVQTYLACTKLGAVTAVFNTAYRVMEMTDVLQRSDTEILFYEGGFRDSVFEEMVPAIKEQLAGTCRFIHLNEKESGEWLAPSSFTGEEKSKRDFIRSVTDALPAEATLNIIFTSGTTSHPKGVQLSHFNIVNMCLRMQKCMHWTSDDKTIIAVSMYHGFGLNAGVAGCVVAGSTMHIIPGFRTEPVWDAIEKYHCSVMLGVPSMYLALVAREGINERDGSALRSGIVGGADIRYDEYKRIVAHFPNMNLIPSFGMTEAATSSSYSDWDDPCHGEALTCGKFYEDAYARIADLKTGEVLCTNLVKGTQDEFLPAGSEKADWPGFAKGCDRLGELQLAGFGIFQGYYNMPDQTKEAFTEDGWFRTGDIGHFTKDGDFVISGRMKGLIIRSGENISPKEIEDAIDETGMVQEVKVVGVPNVYTNEEIAACVIEKENSTLDIKKLMDHLGKRLSYFKQPKFILVFDAFPMTASGKVRLGMLKEEAAKLTKGRTEFAVIYQEQGENQGEE